MDSVITNLKKPLKILWLVSATVRLHSLLYEVVEGLVEDGPLVGGQPELRVVGEADGGPAPVHVPVDADVVGLVPLVQRPVHALDHVVQDAPVGGVADEQQLEI